jgi:hypothetical protein
LASILHVKALQKMKIKGAKALFLRTGSDFVTIPKKLCKTHVKKAAIFDVN